MDMYLEALDRDVKKADENPSIGIILCPSIDKTMAEYTLSRSLSPTMVSEYQRKLIPRDVLVKSLQDYCRYLDQTTSGCVIDKNWPNPSVPRLALLRIPPIINRHFLCPLRLYSEADR